MNEKQEKWRHEKNNKWKSRKKWRNERKKNNGKVHKTEWIKGMQRKETMYKVKNEKEVKEN